MCESKGRTLDRLARAGGSAFVVEPLTLVSVREWQADQSRAINAIREAGLGATVVVRSSAASEDVDRALPPGAFDSALNVPLADDQALSKAVDRVIASYSRRKGAVAASGVDEVLIQTQVLAPELSGIAHFPEHSSYIRVDYDDESGVTNQVTAGRSTKSVAIFAHNDFAIPDPWKAVRKAVFEVKKLGPFSSPVVEFAVTADLLVHVFQAREHPVNSAPVLGFDSRAALRVAIDAVRATVAPWSDMSDWNPAELIGDRPEPLAFSLFCWLISDGAWLEGRSSLGYRRISGRQLVRSFCGKPYVSVERSFLSLTPERLNSEIAKRLVADRIAYLRSAPWLHDKVETRVLFTTVDVCRPARTQDLRARGFSRGEVLALEKELLAITNDMVEQQRDWRAIDEGLAKTLEPARIEDALDVRCVAASILETLKRCRTMCVVPFARHARLAFVARDIMARLRTEGAVDAQWEAKWWSGIRTVMHDVMDAFTGVAVGTLSRDEFDLAVGHLRARTFDIRSPRYDAEQSLPSVAAPLAPPVYEAPSGALMARVSRALTRSGLVCDAREFFRFAAAEIALRENLKFHFSRVLSDALERIAHLGAMLGMSREEMAYATLADIQEIASAGSDVRRQVAALREAQAARATTRAAQQQVLLPELIFEAADLVVVKRVVGRPNFVTNSRVGGPVALVSGHWETSEPSLAGKIAVIEAADPGFDWIFATGIVGLLTRFGGATSHLAIRCAQLNLPAAIGCGESLFRKLSEATHVDLNCAQERLVVDGDTIYESRMREGAN